MQADRRRPIRQFGRSTLNPFARQPYHRGMIDLTPRDIVAALDRHIIGQQAAKRSVAVAVRNRWRRQQLEPELAREVPPRNIVMIGPTGVGKTEIARRLAGLVGAPFIKVEATKYTEVGYHGRDVESMIRDLLELAIKMVRADHAATVQEQAAAATEDRLVDLLLGEQATTPTPPSRPIGGPTGGPANEPADGLNADPTNGAGAAGETSQSTAGATASSTPDPGESARARIRERLRTRLREGFFDDREIEISIEEKPAGGLMGMMGPEQFDPGMSQMFENLMPKRERRRRMTVARARDILLEQETARLVDNEKVTEQAIERTEQTGIVFLDELDKIATKDGRSAEVSREGVQRDLLPIVEGSAVNTRHGVVHTDQILFVAAGAFHVASPSDLMPELQGRFPIRVELEALGRDDFRRILVEPDASLVRQQCALLGAEGLEIVFTDDALDALADLAAEANSRMENIGARRLMTIMEQVCEDLAFDAPDRVAGGERRVTIDEAMVRDRLAAVMADEDLSRFVL